MKMYNKTKLILFCTGVAMLAIYFIRDNPVCGLVGCMSLFIMNIGSLFSIFSKMKNKDK